MLLGAVIVFVSAVTAFVSAFAVGCRSKEAASASADSILPQFYDSFDCYCSLFMYYCIFSSVTTRLLPDEAMLAIDCYLTIPDPRHVRPSPTMPRLLLSRGLIFCVRSYDTVFPDGDFGLLFVDFGSFWSLKGCAQKLKPTSPAVTAFVSAFAVGCRSKEAASASADSILPQFYDSFDCYCSLFMYYCIFSSVT
ncbi:hypothetical protein OIU85_004048, partial [Salix viminalis]